MFLQKSLLEEEEEKPLDMTWPDDNIKRLTYVCLAPVLIPMWVTIPDVRKEVSSTLRYESTSFQGAKKWYPITFINSILWIAFFSYLMVWWANTIGETLVIPTEVANLFFQKLSSSGNWFNNSSCWYLYSRSDYECHRGTKRLGRHGGLQLRRK